MQHMFNLLLWPSVLAWWCKELEKLNTYPSEILPGMLYLGKRSQAMQPYVLKDLKIETAIGCGGSPSAADQIVYFFCIIIIF